jgi:hypothetical protein
MSSIENLPGDGSEKVPIVWREVASSDTGLKSLRQGDIVTGFDSLEEIDIFADLIGHALRGEQWNSTELVLPRTHINDHTGKHYYAGWRASAQPPSLVMRPKSFTGQIVNPKVVMMNNELIDEFKKRVELGLYAEKFARGLGIIGCVSKVCIISVAANGWKLINAGYRYTPNRAPDSPIGTIDLGSTSVIRELGLRGLQRVYSGGSSDSNRRTH